MDVECNFVAGLLRQISVLPIVYPAHLTPYNPALIVAGYPGARPTLKYENQGFSGPESQLESALTRSSGSTVTQMVLCIRALRGGKQADLSVTSKTTVAAIKKQLAATWDIDLAQSSLRLLHKGKVLLDNRTVDFYRDITDRAALTAMIVAPNSSATQSLKPPQAAEAEAEDGPDALAVASSATATTLLSSPNQSAVDPIVMLARNRVFWTEIRQVVDKNMQIIMPDNSDTEVASKKVVNFLTHAMLRHR